MDPKSSLGGAVIGASLATVAVLVAKGGDMTATDIKAAADEIRAQEAAIAQLVEVQDPDILRAVPEHAGKLLGCNAEVAELGSPRDPSYRVSYYACRWLGEDGSIDVQRLTDEEEGKAREALKDDSKRPELVHVEAPPEAPKDPHPRDLSVPVYQTGK
jgi:hypothetical protein